jgi:uncharacterized protein (UPF0332 family)
MNDVETLIKKSLNELETLEFLFKNNKFDLTASRAYYAMYYAVQALFALNKIVCSSHSGLISTFFNQFVRNGKFSKDIGRLLSNAFDTRQTSDYNFTVEIKADDAAESLKQSRQFVTEIIKYINRGKAH